MARPKPAKVEPLSRPSNTFTEIGVTGLVQYSGYVQEEFLTELKGIRWRRIVREMVNNDPIVAAMLFAIEYLCRQVTWGWKPAGEGKDAQDKASHEFAEQCWQDMSQAISDLIAEILSFVPWGWSYFEIVYKQRQGEQREPGKASKFDDNKVGWRKLAIRGQESLLSWDFDEEGGVQAMKQMAAPKFETKLIDIEKALLFRTSTHKNNPEGRSLLRSAYRPWYFKKNIENFEAIGIERYLAGLPVITAPARILSKNASDDEKELAEYLRRMATTIRMNEMGGVLMPSDPHKDTTIPAFSLSLLNGGARNDAKTRETIEGKNQEILMSTMADLLMVGHQKVGSFALVDKKADLFTEGLGSFLDTIAEVINRHATPRLMRLNGMPPASAPRLEHGSVQKLSLKELSEILGSGQNIFTPREVAHLIERAGLPKRSEEEIAKEEGRREERRNQPPSVNGGKNNPEDSDTSNDQ